MSIVFNPFIQYYIGDRLRTHQTPSGGGVGDTRQIGADVPGSRITVVWFTAKVARRKYRVCETPIRYIGHTYQAGKNRDGLALSCIVRY